MWRLLALLAFLPLFRACKLDVNAYEKGLTMAQRLTRSHFVVLAVDVKRYTVQEDGKPVTKGLFDVHCVFKPLASIRNISSQIVIREVENRMCSVTHIKPGEVVVIGLREIPCVSADDCEFEYDDVNLVDSYAFPFTAEVRDTVTTTCGLENFRPPKFCDGEPVKNQCPARPFTKTCVPASAPGGYSSWLLVAVITLYSISWSV